MNSKTTNLILTTAFVALAAPAHAQVRAAKVIPAQAIPAAGQPAMESTDSIVVPPDPSGMAQPAGAVPPAAATPFSPAEIEELKKLFASLEEPEQAEMRAYYADFGIDLDAALGLAAERNADVQRGQMISNFMREMDFTRKPEAVLAARAKLGFGGVAQPNPTTAQPMEVARWIHLQVMAGEWATFANFMRARPLAEAEPVYAAILQAMNRGDIGLLPEEVLALAEASPSEFKAWQVQSLSRMLRQAAAKYSTGSMVAVPACSRGPPR